MHFVRADLFGALKRELRTLEAPIWYSFAHLSDYR